MNFLAHTHLSGQNEDVIFGNFVADSIKGNSYMSFRNDIITGILLHRKIDSYTDGHLITKESRDLVRDHFGKFSGIVVDIYYDHFLAKNWENYHHQELSAFSSKVYQILARRFLILPPRIKRLLPFLIAQNWLSGYANITDLGRVFNGMDRRTGYISGMDNAIKVLENNYGRLENDFTTFYKELQDYAEVELSKLSKD